MSKSSQEIAEIAKVVAATLAAQSVEAAKALEVAKIDAARLVSNTAAATAVAAAAANPNNSNDHDLLTRLEENVTLNFSQIKEAIRDLTTGTASTLTDHESRIRRLELYGALAVGFLYAIQAYLQFFKK